MYFLNNKNTKSTLTCFKLHLLLIINSLLIQNHWLQSIIEIRHWFGWFWVHIIPKVFNRVLHMAHVFKFPISVFKFHQTHVIYTVNTENVPCVNEDGREQIKICNGVWLGLPCKVNLRSLRCYIMCTMWSEALCLLSRAHWKQHSSTKHAVRPTKWHAQHTV